MHDIRAIRETPELFEQAWAAKGSSGRVAEILELDATLRAAQTLKEQAQAERNDASRKYGQAKRSSDDGLAMREMIRGENAKVAMSEHAELERAAGDALRDILSSLPNIPAKEVPSGSDENDNVEVRRWGEPWAINSPRNHADLGEASGLLDFEAAVRISGSRFTVLKGELARLERAIGQFMLDLQTREHGYLEVSPPLLVRDDAMFGTGQLPKFALDLFKTDVSLEAEVRSQYEYLRNALANSERGALVEGLRSAGAAPDDPDVAALIGNWIQSVTDRAQTSALERLVKQDLPTRRWLIPTAEVSLTNLVREQITAEEKLPLRFTALTPCFRSEAGASGRDTRGMIRQHQFYKVELVSIVAPEELRGRTRANGRLRRGGIEAPGTPVPDHAALLR